MIKHLISENSPMEPEEKKEAKPLPENVTDEPQAEEHMHLKHIKHSPSLVEVYLPVSDDSGGLLGEPELEKQVIAFIDQYWKTEVESENLDSVLNELRTLYKTYSIKVNRCDSISSGIVTKYRIRQGMLLNLEKRLTKMQNKQWIDHFAKFYGLEYLRTAQDYMALANIPNIIRYAVYGKERLMEINRAIKTLDISGDDPVAGFLEKYSISFDPDNPENQESLKELKIEIDAAIAMIKINKIEKDRSVDFGVRPDLIKRLVRLGITIDNGIIKDMVIVKESGGDVNQHLDNVYIIGGKADPIVKSTKGVQGFPKLVASFKTTVDYIKENADLAQSIDRRKIDELEGVITELKTLIDNQSNNN